MIFARDMIPLIRQRRVTVRIVGPFWRESARDVEGMLSNEKRQLKRTRRRLEDVLDLAGKL